MICSSCHKEAEKLIRYNSNLICSQCHKKKWHTSEMNKLRKKVIERDKNTCQLCSVNYGVMEVHHKIPIEQGGLTELDNLITICFECHRKKIHNFKIKEIEINKSINNFFDKNN